MDKYIWLIGGSEMSAPICQEIKRRGYKILLTDGNPTCYCRPLSDLFRCLNVYDVRAHLNSARYFKPKGELTNYDIAAVLTVGTDAGPTVSALSDYYGLPGIPPQTAELVKDKGRMRQRLGLPIPYFFLFHAGSNSRYFEPDLFPMIIKPTDQAGSRGIRFVKSQAELTCYIDEYPDRDFLLEQVLQGEDVLPKWREKGYDTSEAAFDFFVEDGEVIYANGALRLFWAGHPAIEAGHINPFPADSRIMKIAEIAARGLGVTWGPFKIDVKQDRRYGWCLLETATRLSGGYDHMYTAPLATGRDITGVMLDVALGGSVDRSKLVDRLGRVACCLAPRFEPGELIHWQSTGQGDHLFITKQRAIPALTCNQDRPVFIIASGDSRDEALMRTLEASRLVQPVYEGVMQ